MTKANAPKKRIHKDGSIRVFWVEDHSAHLFPVGDIDEATTVFRTLLAYHLSAGRHQGSGGLQVFNRDAFRQEFDFVDEQDRGWLAWRSHQGGDFPEFLRKQRKLPMKPGQWMSARSQKKPAPQNVDQEHILVDLLDVLNEDAEGDYFICREAKGVVQRLQDAAEKIKSKKERK